MAARSILLAGVITVGGLTAAAFARDAAPAPPALPEPSPLIAAEPRPADTGPIAGVSFVDSYAAADQDRLLAFGARSETPLRLSNLPALSAPDLEEALAPRSYEVSLTAPAARTGLGLDVGVAHRTVLSLNADGELTGAGAGAELRLGQRLDRLVRPWRPPTWDQPTWYVFAGADDTALTWRPEAAANIATSGVRWQDRVEMGDFQAGLSLEAGGLQASLAYIQRDVSTEHGSVDENFTGVTLTWSR